MNHVLSQLKTLLDNNLRSSVDTIYQGEVVVPAKSYLPAVMIIPNSTDIEARSTNTDETIYDITIRLVIDIKKSFDEAGSGDLIDSTEKMINIMEERNTSDNTLKSDTVCGILRENDTTSEYIYQDGLSVDYDPAQVGEWFIQQAEVNISTTYDIINR